MQNSKLKKLTEHIHVLEEKLQNAFNENAKLRVKQKEDEKLWKGLESKFTSTKTLCDQLTETLQYLAGQVHDGRLYLVYFSRTTHFLDIFHSCKYSISTSTAEKDKEFFNDKMSTSASALDNLHDQMKTLSLRLESSEETVRNCKLPLFHCFIRSFRIISNNDNPCWQGRS